MNGCTHLFTDLDAIMNRCTNLFHRPAVLKRFPQKQKTDPWCKHQSSKTPLLHSVSLESQSAGLQSVSPDPLRSMRRRVPRAPCQFPYFRDQITMKQTSHRRFKRFFNVCMYVFIYVCECMYLCMIQMCTLPFRLRYLVSSRGVCVNASQERSMQVVLHALLVCQPKRLRGCCSTCPTESQEVVSNHLH